MMQARVGRCSCHVVVTLPFEGCANSWLAALPAYQALSWPLSHGIDADEDAHHASRHKPAFLTIFRETYNGYIFKQMWLANSLMLHL